MDQKIATNGHWRNLVYRYDVPKKVLEDQFEHLEDEHDGFIFYRGTWYHISDFMRFGYPGPRETVTIGGYEWDGSLSECAWSGVVIALHPEGEQYRIGRVWQ